MEFRKLTVSELPLLTQLFDYNNVADMIAQNTRQINNGEIDIWVLSEGDRLIGELHTSYESDAPLQAVRNKRAYLSAFRVHEDFQGRGYGKQLLKNVIAALSDMGYHELTIGVEDDNERAKHIYNEFGFTELIERKSEEYQGDAYEYGLYLYRGK